MKYKYLMLIMFPSYKCVSMTGSENKSESDNLDSQKQLLTHQIYVIKHVQDTSLIIPETKLDTLPGLVQKQQSTGNNANQSSNEKKIKQYSITSTERPPGYYHDYGKFGLSASDWD